jgi:hypothetical protein
MSDKEHKDRLDIELRRAINTTTPRFDAGAWQQKYRREFETLLSRAGANHNQRSTLKFRPRLWLAVAAAIAVAACGLICWTEYYRTPAPSASAPAHAKSPAQPAQLVTMSSLSSAYRRGGMEAVDKQLNEAVRLMGPRPVSLPTARLLTDLGS